ncbi:MAG: thiolase family protein [Planctomycetales bacterium]|nr:thiolase family protein [Planctomycetales bacterium]
MADAFIVSGVRTPIGALNGLLAEVPAVELGAIAIKQSLVRTGMDGADVDEVIMGNVVGAGQGQNPARQASIKAGVPQSVGAFTVNKVCGSGLKSVMLAAQSIQLGESQIVVAGGMENMSRAPYLLPQARQGYRLGNGVLVDSVVHDGLWDVYGDKHMGTYGDNCASQSELSRQQQDDFAVRSYQRARQAQVDGVFSSEVVPVTFTSRRNEVTVSEDEGPAKFNEEKLRSLRPAFGADGTVTAGNASSINDGAAAVVVAADSACKARNLKPMARIAGMSSFSREPQWFTLAPIGAIQKLLDRIGWTVESTDLFEINEAFAAVTLAAEKALQIPADKVNIYGGAVSLGHPIGCSGTRILVTLLNALQRTGGRRGIASLCIGGGEAVAMAVERLD